MSDGKNKIGDAVASPSKAFFVRMLTRDIELEDAILDLLDNCVDGILRSVSDGGRAEPYDGFHAKIILARDYFIIEDNCGGIPIDRARSYAFSMGRRGIDLTEATLPTVGMYGIGMKRAVFKLGGDAIVESRNDIGFQVLFSPEWMASEDWSDLPMYELPDERLKNKGTRIEVHQLHADVARCFSESTWIERFSKMVSQHYSIIIEKGFKIYIAGDEASINDASPLPAEKFKLLKTQSEGDRALIEPYVYVGKIADVNVEIYAGLYRRLLNQEELDEEEETRGRKDDAGWTVACNDRIVIWKDRTRLTGWGEANVPNYHGQFIAITGIVLLSSSDAKRLPLTTTKRGIDASSDVYLTVKNLMRDVTKNLTSFTNKWKRYPDGLEEIYKNSEYVDLSQLRKKVQDPTLNKVRKMDSFVQNRPSYPEPEREKTSVRISFLADRNEVTHLARHFFDDERVKASEVGEQSFSYAYREIIGGQK